MKLNVLMVDNEPELLDVASLLLERQGAQVFTARSFRNAESILNQQHIHLIICDFDLPCGNGVDWMKHLRILGHRPLFLIYTGDYDVLNQQYPALEGTLKTVLKTDIAGLMNSLEAAKMFWEFEEDGPSQRGLVRGAQEN